MVRRLKIKKEKDKEEKIKLSKIGYKKLSMKPILKKQKQAVVIISEPRELPSDYQNPYIKREIEQEKRRIFFS